MLEGKNNWKAWLYLTPALILLAIFSFYPIIKSFVIAFIRDYSPIKDVFRANRDNNNANGLGFFTIENFITVIKNPSFKYAVINTLLIAFVSVPISVFLSLFIAVLLTSTSKLKGFFQTLFFLPYVTSAMAVAMAFTVLFANTGVVGSENLGPVNTAIKAVGLDKPLIAMFDSIEWAQNGKKTWRTYICHDKDDQIDLVVLEKKYQDEKRIATFIGKDFDYSDAMDYHDNYLLKDTETYNKYRYHFKSLGYLDWIGANATWGTAIIVVLIYSVWSGMAFKILVFTGGLTSIDRQYYDAAKIDGTTKWRTFWKITVPMMSPLIVYILITSLIGSFKSYTAIVGLFGESMGPAGSSGLMMTFVGLVYQYMNEGNELIHLGAAAAVSLFLIILVITQLTNRFTKKRVHY